MDNVLAVGNFMILESSAERCLVGVYVFTYVLYIYSCACMYVCLGMLYIYMHVCMHVCMRVWVCFCVLGVFLFCKQKPVLSVFQTL